LTYLICVLLDNHSAHRSQETRQFLSTKPGRFEFVFTPTHAFWLNWVETFFSKVARSVLRRIRVTRQG
jgi:transposase